MAIAFDALGQLDDALQEFDLGIRGREPLALWVALRPRIYGVKHWVDDPRFEEMK